MIFDEVRYLHFLIIIVPWGSVMAARNRHYGSCHVVTYICCNLLFYYLAYLIFYVVNGSLVQYTLRQALLVISAAMLT